MDIHNLFFMLSYLSAIAFIIVTLATFFSYRKGRLSPGAKLSWDTVGFVLGMSFVVTASAVMESVPLAVAFAAGVFAFSYIVSVVSYNNRSA